MHRTPTIAPVLLWLDVCCAAACQPLDKTYTEQWLGFEGSASITQDGTPVPGNALGSGPACYLDRSFRFESGNAPPKLSVQTWITPSGSPQAPLSLSLLVSLTTLPQRFGTESLLSLSGNEFSIDEVFDEQATVQVYGTTEYYTPTTAFTVRAYSLPNVSDPGAANWSSPEFLTLDFACTAQTNEGTMSFSGTVSSIIGKQTITDHID